MRLDQVYIRQYGPVQKDLDLEGDINVVSGPNESGKSLLVEAVLKQLSPDTVPKPVIDDVPEGFVEVTAGTVSETLRDEDSLTEFCKEQYNQDVRGEELRNVFVIRRGDLSFNEGDDFYSHITDKLTGRRVEDIDEIMDELIDQGRLTGERLDISSKQEYHDAGDQLEDAQKLKEDVHGYIEEAEEDELNRAEVDLFAARRREEELEERIDELEEAKEAEQKHSRFDNLVDDKKTIEENLDELASLPDSSDLQAIDRRLQELSEKEGRKSELEGQKGWNRSLAKWSIGGGAVVTAGLLAAGFSLVGLLAPVLFLAAAGYFWYKANDIGDTISELNVEEETILSDARAMGISFEGRDEIREEIARIEAKRGDLEQENQGKKAVLERELEFEADSMQDAVDKAEGELEALSDELDDSIEIDYDEDEYDSKIDELQDVKFEREELEQSLESHRKKLQEFQERAYALDFSVFVGERLDSEVENLDALEKLEDTLDKFISSIEEDAEASRVAIQVFNDIQDEEKEETAELFEEGSRATELFQEITNGRYTKVTYDNEENQLEVEKSTGEVFLPEDLSDGTRDQLYLSIRVALGEKILEGNSGFFIMDDAFLTSDSSRLQTQADVVETLSDEGWQIIYLSSKEDAISVLSEKTGGEVIELSTLE